MSASDSPAKTAGSVLLRLVALTLLLLGAIAAARLTFAELLARQETPESLRRAASVAPNALYFERIAEIDPDQAVGSLLAALAINPRSSAAFIGLGLAAEHAGDFKEAGPDLEAAARVDRQYLPAWTLANFHFRRGDRDLFWHWARRAAALSYDDPAPLLMLADRIGRVDPIHPIHPNDAPGHTMARLAASPRLERAYLDLLVGENRIDDATAAARLIVERIRAAHGDIDDRTRLRAFTTRLIAANRGADALEIWNGIGAGDTDRDPIRLDDSLPQPSQEGFDWRLQSSVGVSSIWRHTVLDFILDGRQPELCPLLERMVALPAGSLGKPHRLHFEYWGGLTGVRWDFDEKMESQPLEISSDWRESEWSFTPAPGHPVAVPLRVALRRLVLLYRRDPGELPASGRLQIRNLRLEIE